MKQFGYGKKSNLCWVFNHIYTQYHFKVFFNSLRIQKYEFSYTSINSITHLIMVKYQCSTSCTIISQLIKLNKKIVQNLTIKYTKLHVNKLTIHMANINCTPKVYQHHIIAYPKFHTSNVLIKFIISTSTL